MYFLPKRYYVVFTELHIISRARYYEIISKQSFKGEIKLSSTTNPDLTNSEVFILRGKKIGL